MLRKTTSILNASLSFAELERRKSERRIAVYKKWRELFITCYRESSWCTRHLYALQKVYVDLSEEQRKIAMYLISVNQKQDEAATKVKSLSKEAIKVSIGPGVTVDQVAKKLKKKYNFSKLRLSLRYTNKLLKELKGQERELNESRKTTLRQLEAFESYREKVKVSQMPFREEYRRLIFEGKNVEAEALLLAKYNAILSGKLDSFESTPSHKPGRPRVNKEEAKISIEENDANKKTQTSTATSQYPAITSVRLAKSVKIRSILSSVAEKRRIRLRQQYAKRAQLRKAAAKKQTPRSS